MAENGQLHADPQATRIVDAVRENENDVRRSFRCLGLELSDGKRVGTRGHAHSHGGAYDSPTRRVRGRLEGGRLTGHERRLDGVWKAR